MLLECVANAQVAGLGRGAVPLHGVTTRPLTGRGGAGGERHRDAVAGVVAGAAHLGESPRPAEMLGAPVGVGLEAAAGEHHRARADAPALPALLHFDRFDAIALSHQRDRARLVNHADLRLAGGAAQREHEPRAAAIGLQREAAPEVVAAVSAYKRLVAPERHEPHALARDPTQGGTALGDQGLRQRRIGAPAAGAIEIGSVLGLGVGAEVGAGAILRRELRRHLEQVLDPVVGEAHRRHGEAAVAAVLAFGRALEHGDPGTALARRERGAQRGVARAYDDDVVAFVHGEVRPEPLRPAVS